MTSESSNSKPKSVNTLNPHESFDPFVTGRVQGIKVVSIIDALPDTSNWYLVAFYKNKKILIPIRF